MARPLRIQFENAYYHVTCRGNARQDIFNGERDYGVFLELLARSSEIYDVEILVYVLMTNHFHLLLRTPRANLQEFMRHFNISYTSHFNRTYRRSGHLFQGRYKSFLIDADDYLLAASRYVHLNPVRVSDLKDLTLPEKKKYLNGYRWSSYPGYVTEDRQSPFVRFDILDAFGADRAACRKSYQRFVEEGLTEGLENPLQRGTSHGIVGGEAFLSNVRHLMPQPRAREIPGIRHLAKVSAETVLQAVERQTGSPRAEFLAKSFRGPARPLAMELLYRCAGMNQREIGQAMGIDYSTVSVSRKRFQLSLEKDPGLRRMLEDVKAVLLG